jgi:ribonuclease Z
VKKEDVEFAEHERNESGGPCFSCLQLSRNLDPRHGLLHRRTEQPKGTPIGQHPRAVNLAFSQSPLASLISITRSQRRLLATCTRLQSSPKDSTPIQIQRAPVLAQDLFSYHKTTSGPERQPHKSGELQAQRGLLQNSARLNRAPKLRGQRQRHHLVYPPSASVQVPKGPGLFPDTKFRRMRSFFQFVTTPTADTPGTTLLLHFDNKRYLIGNIAEGTQRASVEQKVRLLKVSELFLTGDTTWEKTGGLIGMILTLADSASSSAQASLLETKRKILTKLERQGADVSDQSTADQAAEQAASEVKDKVRLSIFGGPNLNYTLATARRFVFRKGMPVDVHEYGHDLVQAPSVEPTWSDDNIQVWALPLSPASKVPSASSSPRKRSYDELNGQEDLKTAAPLHHADKEKALMMSKSVVSNMFDSSWRLDALVETPINEVQLPATLFVHDPETHKMVKYTGPMPGGTEPVPNIKVLVRRPWPGALIETLPPTEPVKVAMSYIFRNHIVRGRFQPQKAIALGIEKGPKWAALGKGQNVENDKGETVTPDMVLEPSKQGGGAAVIDLPSREYVEALVSRPEWKSEEIMAGVGAFIWILGPDVASHPMLKQFMEEMKHMKHVVSSPELCSNRLAFDSAAGATIRLGQIDPTRYNIPVHDDASASQSFESTSGLKGLISIADRGQRVQLEPSIEIQDNEVNALLDVDKVKAEMSKDVLDRARVANEDVKASKQALEAWADSLPQKDVEITTLGTGSALPSKYRNVSATLVRVPGWGSMLLDAGENTMGQLRRVYAPNELNEIMKGLRVIWISHMHADHHLGTVSVIREWYKIVHGSQPAPVINPGLDVGFDAAAIFSKQDRLSVISEPAMLHWLEEYSHVEDYGFSRLAPLCITPNVHFKKIKSTLQWFIPPSSTQSLGPKSAFTHESWANKTARAQVSPQALNLQDIQCVQVQHCHGARAVSVTFPSGFKASYSGDCRPSKPFTHIGKGSTVCIHEATFDDELQGDAEAKNHTTTSEALSVALGMGAKACVLTHFSQRYQKVPVLEYTDEEDGTVSSLAANEDEMDISTNTDDEADAPVTDAAAPPSEPKAPVDATGANKAAKHIKIKAGSDMKVCVAFDYMKIKVGDIAQMEKYTDTLVALFAEEELSEVKPEAPKKVKGKGSKTQRNN